MVVVLLLLFAPVLQTLTRSYASDSIWALTIFLSGVHLLFQDYRQHHHAVHHHMEGGTPLLDHEAGTGTSTGTDPVELDEDPGEQQGRLYSVVSLSAAMVAGVLLASRLPDTMHVFVFLVFTVELLVLFPAARAQLRAASESAHLAVTVVLACLALGLVGRQSPLLAGVFLAAVGGVGFLCPGLVLALRGHKTHVRGPWDLGRAGIQASIG